MSVTAEGWESRKLFKVQRVKVKSVLEESQGHAYFVSLIKVTAIINHLFHLTLYQFFEEETSNQSLYIEQAKNSFYRKSKTLEV